MNLIVTKESLIALFTATKSALGNRPRATARWMRDWNKFSEELVASNPQAVAPVEQPRREDNAG